MEQAKESTYPLPIERATFLEVCLRGHKNGTHWPFSVALREELAGLCKRWERCVWFRGLQAFLAKEQYRGHELVTSGGATMLTYVIAGRCAVTIRAEGGEVSFVADETADTPRTGLQSADGDLDVIQAAVGEVIAAWAAGARPRVAESAGFG